MFYFIRQSKISKLRKAKQNFCNADADADISKWSKKTTASYLGTNIQVQKIESVHCSVHCVICIQIRNFFGPYLDTFHGVLNILKT